MRRRHIPHRTAPHCTAAPAGTCSIVPDSWAPHHNNTASAKAKTRTQHQIGLPRTHYPQRPRFTQAGSSWGTTLVACRKKGAAKFDTRTSEPLLWCSRVVDIMFPAPNSICLVSIQLTHVTCFVWLYECVFVCFFFPWIAFPTCYFFSRLFWAGTLPAPDAGTRHWFFIIRRMTRRNSQFIWDVCGITWKECMHTHCTWTIIYYIYTLYVVWCGRGATNRWT